MCFTKKKKQRNAEPTTGATGAVNSTIAPEQTKVTATSKSTPATTSNEKSKIKKVAAKEKSIKKTSKSEMEKKSENPEKVSELKRMVDQATSVGLGPPVMPPVKRNAKRQVKGEEKDSKDPEYVTLNDTFPTFENAKLKGHKPKDSKEKTICVEPTQKTQPSSGGSDDKKKKKDSGEKTGKE